MKKKKMKPKRSFLQDVFRINEVKLVILFVALSAVIFFNYFLLSNLIVVKEINSSNISELEVAEVKVSSELDTQKYLIRNKSYRDKSISLIDNHMVDESSVDSSFCNPSYERRIIFEEHVIAPIEYVVEVQEDDSEYLGVLYTDSEFKYISTYKDYQTGKVKSLPLSEKTQRFIYKMSKKYELPYKIIIAVLGVETHWNEDPDHVEIHNGTRYIGIACLTEKYYAEKFKALGINIYTLEGNIEAFCYRLKQHLATFDDNIIYAMMAYNGGAAGARNQINDGVKETGYTKKALWYVESFN